MIGSRWLAVAIVMMTQVASAQTRIVTYNVTNLDVDTARWRVREIADDLERLDADIVFLQEVASAQALRAVQRELSTRASIARYEAFQVDTPWNDQEVALLTRHRPVTFRRFDFPALSTSLDRVAYAEFDLPGGRLRAVAVHLKAGIHERQSAYTRNYQVEQVVERIVRPALDAGTRCVLLGDFNDIDRQVRYANGRAPDAASRVFDLVRQRAPELRNTDVDLPVRERITSGMGYMYDHFVVDRRLAARVFVDRASTRDGVVPSDHWPVALDLAPLDARPVRLTGAARALPAAGDARDVVPSSEPGDVVDAVSVRLVISHARLDDLEVRLTHGGRTATLLDAGDHEEGGRSLDRRVVTTAFAGAPASGAWTLEVVDRGHPLATSGGQLATWELHAAAR
jgi:endonuclease/exonuclease/phosphatase family metal-dependent hydrolase